MAALFNECESEGYSLCDARFETLVGSLRRKKSFFFNKFQLNNQVSDSKSNKCIKKSKLNLVHGLAVEGERINLLLHVLEIARERIFVLLVEFFL